MTYELFRSRLYARFGRDRVYEISETKKGKFIGKIAGDILVTSFRGAKKVTIIANGRTMMAILCTLVNDVRLSFRKKGISSCSMDLLTKRRA